MTTGLALPVGVNTQGGARLISRDEQAKKIIGLALSDLDSDNAFQQGIGLGADLVFDPAGPAFRAKVRQQIFDIFDDFERKKLFKLVRRTLRFEKITAGEQVLQLSFINLESDETVNFEQRFTSAGK